MIAEQTLARMRDAELRMNHHEVQALFRAAEPQVAARFVEHRQHFSASLNRLTNVRLDALGALLEGQEAALLDNLTELETELAHLRNAEQVLDVVGKAAAAAAQVASLLVPLL